MCTNISQHLVTSALKTYSVLDLFRRFNIRTKTAILTFGWIVCASLYYVLLLDQGWVTLESFPLLETSNN